MIAKADSLEHIFAEIKAELKRGKGLTSVPQLELFGHVEGIMLPRLLRVSNPKSIPMNNSDGTEFNSNPG